MLDNKSFIKTVILDLDGVILESVSVKAQALLRLFKNYPEHHEKILSYHFKNQGKGRFNKFKWIYTDLLGKEYNQEIEQKLGKIFSELVFNQMKTVSYVKGVMELLRKLNEKNIPVYVASGTPDNELKKVIEQRDIERYVKESYGSRYSKKRIIQLILRKEQLNPGEVLFIGDGPADYSAAISCGVQFEARHNPQLDIDDFWIERNIDPIHDLREILNKYNW